MSPWDARLVGAIVLLTCPAPAVGAMERVSERVKVLRWSDLTEWCPDVDLAPDCLPGDQEAGGDWPIWSDSDAGVVMALPQEFRKNSRRSWAEGPNAIALEDSSTPLEFSQVAAKGHCVVRHRGTEAIVLEDRSASGCILMGVGRLSSKYWGVPRSVNVVVRVRACGRDALARAWTSVLSTLGPYPATDVSAKPDYDAADDAALVLELRSVTSIAQDGSREVGYLNDVVVATVTNRGGAEATIVQPGSGSTHGTRAPRVQFELTRNRRPVPAPQDAGGAIINSLTMDEVVRLEPGETLILESWFPAFGRLRSGTYTVQMTYDFDPDLPWSRSIDGHDPDALERVHASRAIRLVSNVLRFEIRRRGGTASVRYFP